jgi:hypothetical protein
VELGAENEVLRGWRALHEQHALVLDEQGAIRMAHPFSAVPTAYRTTVAGRTWHANCGWDAFGILGALGADTGRIDAVCPDCGDDYAVDVVDRRIDTPELVFHCVVPASQWYDDITFT